MPQVPESGVRARVFAGCDAYCVGCRVCVDIYYVSCDGRSWVRSGIRAGADACGSSTAVYDGAAILAASAWQGRSTFGAESTACA